MWPDYCRGFVLGLVWVERVALTVGIGSGYGSVPPTIERINKKLEDLLVEMKRLGYHVESSIVLQDVEEEEKERILFYHSEKLGSCSGNGVLGFGVCDLGKEIGNR
ncbi:hypothetical protein L1049_003919 [Liquidambar formosana]|uniref:DYW domain-containing protein n=1 Tax=Liquidambar formosana TaxID=63359 RepID=A0AAP0RR37_LIQFO